MAVLAIDPATHCGWALRSELGLASGVWDLSAGRGRPYTCRGLNLWYRLNELSQAHEIGLLAYEKVERHSSGQKSDRMVKCSGCGKRVAAGGRVENVYAAHLYGGLSMVLEMWAERIQARVETVPVGTIKKFATGHGNATKEDMIAWAKLRWPEQRVGSDDQADALHILDWVEVEILKRRGKVVVDVRQQQLGGVL